LAGSPVYDLVSLLEDARRDVDPILTGELIVEWQNNFPVEQDVFDHHYQFWAAQRHCKVAGIFVRLWLRDGKPGYLVHLNRVMRLLASHLSRSSPLGPLRDWMLGHMNAVDHQPFSGEASELVAFCRPDDSLQK
jgi:aminoglycoside/choline kinase family phosphotransferase